MLRAIQWLTLLSLDAPLVALGWQALLAQASESTIAWHHRAIVFLSVWLGYAADRWFDTARIRSPNTERHHFTSKYAVRLLGLWILALASALILSYQNLSPAELQRGYFLMTGALAYSLFAQTARRLPYYGTIKALFVAILVSASSILFLEPTFLQSPTGFASYALVALLFFANCLCIRAWEEPDTHAATIQPIAMIAISLGSLAAVASLPEARSVSTCVFASISSLWILHKRRHEFDKPALRSLADVCLLWPYLFIALA